MLDGSDDEDAANHGVEPDSKVFLRKRDLALRSLWYVGGIKNQLSSTHYSALFREVNSEQRLQYDLFM